MSDLDLHEAQREIAAALGLPFALRANQTLRSYKITEDMVVAVINFKVTQETVREVRYLKSGTRMMTWTYTGDDGWSDRPANGRVAVNGWEYDEVVIMDDSFKPYCELKIGRVETPEEYRDRREWEGMQYRVGTPTSPMDSAYRVTEGYSPMADYWNRK